MNDAVDDLVVVGVVLPTRQRGDRQHAVRLFAEPHRRQRPCAVDVIDDVTPKPREQPKRETWLNHVPQIRAPRGLEQGALHRRRLIGIVSRRAHQEMHAGGCGQADRRSQAMAVIGGAGCRRSVIASSTGDRISEVVRRRSGGDDRRPLGVTVMFKELLEALCGLLRIDREHAADNGDVVDLADPGWQRHLDAEALGDSGWKVHHPAQSGIDDQRPVIGVGVCHLLGVDADLHPVGHGKADDDAFESAAAHSNGEPIGQRRGDRRTGPR